MNDFKPRKIVGTKAFPNVDAIKSRILEKLKIRVEVIELSHPDGRVLVFKIPSRSIGHPLIRGLHAIMRSDEKLRPMPADQLCRMFLEDESTFLNKDVTLALNADWVVLFLDTKLF